MNSLSKVFLFFVFSLGALSTAQAQSQAESQVQAPSQIQPQTKIVTDMRGKAVVIPAHPQRIATIDDGFVEGVMTHLGTIDQVAAIGSWGMKRDYRYEFETTAGQKYEHRGWNTMKYLHPRLDELPVFNSPQGNILNFETLASAKPDLVIMRVGDCTVNDRQEGSSKHAIEMIEALGIPLIVLYAPKGAELATIHDEMRILGDVFDQQTKALALADYLAQTEQMIRERTAGISEQDKTQLLYLGLSPDARKSGAAGTVFGVNTPESFIIEEIANAKNAYTGKGFGVPMSAEQIYAINPQVIVLPTQNGYHPPRELYEAPYMEVLSELKAVKNKRVYAMPWTPMNCARRVEYPLDMLIIAKAAYPERFSDIRVYDFALQFYQKVYGVDEETAKGLRTTQLLDWMAESDF